MLVTNNDDISLKIQSIFNNNRLNDLHKFMKKRHFLNNCNIFIIYFFYFVPFKKSKDFLGAPKYSLEYL